MTTAIRNISRTIIVLNLTPDVAPKRAVYPRRVTHRDGAQERRDVRIVHGDSIHLLAGETRGGLSNAVRRCPDVINAVARRAIELVEEPEPTAAVEEIVESPTPTFEGDEQEAPASETEAATPRGPRHKSKHG